MDMASKRLSTIIDSIYAHITSHNEPVIIYVSVGCSGILVNQEKENKNRFYHQFPPALQNIYIAHPNVKFYCIYMDELLETPVFITQDQFIANKLNFNVNQWVKTDDEFMYTSSRITIYPVHNYIRINGVSHDRFGIDKSFDITPHLKRLHDIIIEQNVFYLYHDFSGANDYKKINIKFSDQLFNHEDHIIYGLGNGELGDCYPDLEQPFTQLPFMLFPTDNRMMIKSFSIDKIITNYNINEYDIPFPLFLMNYIKNSDYDIKSKIIIYDQVKFFVQKFKELLIQQILYFLRHMIDIQRKSVELYINDYHIEIFGQVIRQVYELYDNRDNSFFDKIKKIIAEKYKIEFMLFAVYDQIINGVKPEQIIYLQADDILNIITSNDDPYKWGSECLKFSTNF
jgi:hypothetical protein